MKIWDRFERLLEEDKDDKKIYLVKRLPSKELDPEDDPIFDHRELIRWTWAIGKLSDECYEWATNLLMELTEESIGNVIADKNRKWICAFRKNNSIAYVKLGDMTEAEVKEDLEKVEDLGNVLQKAEGMH